MANLYLDNTSGDNGNDGSSLAQAFATLDYALGEVSDGDTLYIEASVTDYTKSGYDVLPDNLTIIGSTNIQNPLVNHVVIDCASGGNKGFTIKENLDMTDIIIKDYIPAATDGFFNYASTNVAECTTNLTRVEMRDITLTTSTATRGGFFNTGFNGGDYTRLNINLQNCFLNNIKGSVVNYCALMRLYGTAYVTTKNCTIYDDGTGTYTMGYIATAGNSTNNISSITHKNLAIKSLHSGTINIGIGATDSDDGTVYDGNVTLTGTSTNATNADPLFADPANNLFHPKPDSPLINGGQPV